MSADPTSAGSTSDSTSNSSSKGWAWLLFSSLFEITFALSTNATDGFTQLWPSLLTAAAASCGIFTLSQALKTIDVGVGYTVWSGIGGVGTVVFGTIIYDEPMTVWKVVAFILIIGGALGLRISDNVAAKKAAVV
ncbi:DMT family transporter [Microtetraspora fusca]|uniref:DMT family transporter n=1 Tax=Microtetraspora fusca TaxID=1997 RepID=UPI000A06FE9B|nr:multidrug efflux SMR transporter [Microtetraspora fusca]